MITWHKNKPKDHSTIKRNCKVEDNQKLIKESVNVVDVNFAKAKTENMPKMAVGIYATFPLNVISKAKRERW